MILHQYRFELGMRVVIGCLVAFSLAACGRNQPPTATLAPQPTATAPTPSTATATPPATATIAPQPITTRIAPQLTAGSYNETIAVNGDARRYRLHVPKSYQAPKATPLIINFHGLNSNSGQQENFSGMSQKAESAGFIVAYPDGLGSPQLWRLGNGDEGKADREFILALIRQLQTQLNIDVRHIYATGISNGAQMSERFGCESADIFAAIAPVSGGYFRLAECKPSRPVPVIAFHGTDDKLLPYEGQGQLLLPVKEWAAQWAKRNGCNPTPRVVVKKGDLTGEAWNSCKQDADVILYTIKGGGHTWPGSGLTLPLLGYSTKEIDATEAIWNFFISHPKPR